MQQEPWKLPWWHCRAENINLLLIPGIMEVHNSKVNSLGSEWLNFLGVLCWLIFLEARGTVFQEGRRSVWLLKTHWADLENWWLKLSDPRAAGTALFFSNNPPKMFLNRECVSMYGACALEFKSWGSWKGRWDLLELQEVVSHLIWVLGFEMDSSARVGAPKPLSHLPSPSNDPYRNFKVSLTS